ncbi:MAG: DUF294 nucleotidyltransferase-like domain-containing protein [Alphaproteobacteria bacterium]|nr:DUF294 nucleotidyltransferase-like domain-containing protein [Alphaproteobacteria bacterium]
MIEGHKGSPQGLSQTAVFKQLVRHHMGQAPVLVPTGTSCAEALGRIASERASSVVVVQPNGRPLGIVTESDVSRRIAFRADAAAPIEDFMSAPVETIRDDDYLYHAIARMRSNGLRHMPVIGGAGAVVGVLELHRALAAALGPVLGRIDDLSHEETRSGIAEVKAAEVEVAAELLAESVPANEILSLLTHVNNDIYRRLCELCQREMRDQGWGQAPLDFAVIVMGSAGRGESFLNPDQDNGFILEDYPDHEHDSIDAYFLELAERLTGALNEVGFPFCRGNVMASNPLWRKSISQWCGQIDYWVRKRNDVTLRLSDIFFDFRAAVGNPALAQRLREHIARNLKGNTPFLQAVYRSDAEHKVALGLFGRLITDSQDEIHRGELNLKITGTLPLVEAIRALSLGHGVTSVGTLERINELHQAGVLDANEQDYLSGAFQHISFLLLRQQLADFAAGRPVGNHLPPDRLSQRERDMLVDSFKAVAALRGRMRTELTGEIF